MSKNKIFVIISCLISNFFVFSPVFADKLDKNNIILSENSVNNNKYNSGENFSVNLKFDSPEELEEKFNNNFVLQINFDNNILKYKKFKYAGKFRKNALKVTKNSNIIQISHDFEETPKRRPKNLTDFTENFEFFFDIKNNCESCDTNINFKFININTNETINLCTKNINITESPELKKCKLQNLIPSTGNLDKKFDPDIYNYEIFVDYNIQYMKFDLTPMSQNLNIKVNRHKLKPAGSNTEIKIKVSNPELKIKNIYNITVHRKEKPVKNTQKPKTKSQNKSKNNNKSKKQNKIINKTEKNIVEQKEILENYNSCDENNTEIILETKNNTRDIYIYIIITSTIILILIYSVYKFIKNKTKN